MGIGAKLLEGTHCETRAPPGPVWVANTRGARPRARGMGRLYILCPSGAWGPLVWERHEFSFLIPE